jgi:hypothetical protein
MDRVAGPAREVPERCVGIAAVPDPQQHRVVRVEPESGEPRDQDLAAGCDREIERRIENARVEDRAAIAAEGVVVGAIRREDARDCDVGPTVRRPRHHEPARRVHRQTVGLVCSGTQVQAAQAACPESCVGAARRGEALHPQEPLLALGIVVRGRRVDAGEAGAHHAAVGQQRHVA